MERMSGAAQATKYLGNRPSIAHLLPWPTIGGVEIATFRLIEETKQEFRHIAFCMPETPELGAALQVAGAEVVTYLPPQPSARHFLRYLSESRLVADLLRRHNVDLAHCSELKAAYHNSLAALLVGVPLVSHVRSRFSSVPFRERLTYLPVKQYIFVSKDSRRQFGLKVPDRKARVLYDAVSVPEPTSEGNAVREEFNIPRTSPLVGMVARVNPQKDYFTLANAAAKVIAKRPETRFFIVGDNTQVELNRQHYAEVRVRLRELGLAQNFIFSGFRSDVPRLVAAMDVFILCTHREGLPLSILEAMAMGKPVLATAVDGIPEVIQDGVTGLLHGHKDSDKLAQDILACIEDAGWAGHLGGAARDHVSAQYTCEAFARNAARIYYNLLSRRVEGPAR